MIYFAKKGNDTYPKYISVLSLYIYIFVWYRVYIVCQTRLFCFRDRVSFDNWVYCPNCFVINSLVFVIYPHWRFSVLTWLFLASEKCNIITLNLLMVLWVVYMYVELYTCKLVRYVNYIRVQCLQSYKKRVTETMCILFCASILWIQRSSNRVDTIMILNLFFIIYWFKN